VYPFEGATSFVTRAWYVAGWSDEITEKPIARTILGQSVALFRVSTGEPVALSNRCTHRGLPLAMGTVNGDEIACGYHGFVFGLDGRCRRIPSQERVPPGIAVRQYPVAERWDWVWIWMGDPAFPDYSLLPDTQELGLGGDPWLAVRGDDFHVRARYQLFNENLLDLTHLSFLHADSIGTPDLLESQMTVDVVDRTVRVERCTRSEQMSPFYARRLGIPIGRIDRRHVTSFVAPTFHVVHVIAAKEGTGVGPAPAVLGEHKILHAITPETETTLHDFWALTRTYNTSDEMTAYLRENINGVIRQDIVALEATEAALAGCSDRPLEFSCAADEAALKGRRLIQQLLRAERPPNTEEKRR
jgi:vanillate O-demethylase monooxygenase subunit